MNKLAPIEFKNQRIMTTKTLAEEFGTEENNINKNFSRNKERFVQGKHYYQLQGDELQEFKRVMTNSTDPSIKFTSVLTLWTEKGAARHAKILDTDEAWEVYEALEETYFRVKEAKPTCIEDVLIQSLQEMKDMRVQLQQTNAKVIEANTNAAEAKEEVQAIKDIITINPKAEWRKQTNLILNRIAHKIGDYEKPKNEAYTALKDRGRCRLEVSLRNLQARAALNGMAKSKIDTLNNLDVIENDSRLKEIYIAIVKDMAIKHQVSI